MRTAIYPGTFDPITLGHVDLIRRGSQLFDRLVVAVADSRSKRPLFELDRRLELCREALAELDNVSVASFEGLLVHAARELGCTIVLRGVRAVADYEYELQLANMNRAMMPELETIFLTPQAELASISSTLVREIAGMGGAFDQFVPAVVAAALHERFGG